MCWYTGFDHILVIWASPFQWQSTWMQHTHNLWLGFVYKLVLHLIYNLNVAGHLPKWNVCVAGQTYSLLWSMWHELPASSSCLAGTHFWWGWEGQADSPSPAWLRTWRWVDCGMWVWWCVARIVGVCFKWIRVLMATVFIDLLQYLMLVGMARTLHTYRIYVVYMISLAWKPPYIWSYTVYIYGYGRP